MDYEIYSKPDYIMVYCSNCKDVPHIPFEDIDYDTDYWGDGGWVTCPTCGKHIRLENYTYY